jgi:hypothetical protein
MVTARHLRIIVAAPSDSGAAICRAMAAALAATDPEATCQP